MARRWTGNMNGEQYLANTSSSKREVHDLDQETTQCHIDNNFSFADVGRLPSHDRMRLIECQIV